MDDAGFEREKLAKGLTAPRVTPESIDRKIVDASYHVWVGTTLTVCILTLENGYTVVGHAACSSPENFDAELGRKLSYEHARDQIWALEGYLLRENLHIEAQLRERARAGESAG